MTGVTFGYWNGKFISLCDPNPPATEAGRQKLIIRPFPGTSVIPAASAAQLAVNGLKEAGLFAKPGNWQLILNRVEPGQPQLVQRLDHPDEYYYIVPMMSGGNLEAASRVDARFGVHLGSILSPRVLTGGSAAAAASPLFLSHEEATARVVDQRIDLGLAGRVMIRPEGMVPYPTLVWKPCLESLSPYYPFRMFIAGTTHLYVRVDGKIFTQLHDDSRGV